MDVDAAGAEPAAPAENSVAAPPASPGGAVSVSPAASRALRSTGYYTTATLAGMPAELDETIRGYSTSVTTTLTQIGLEMTPGAPIVTALRYRDPWNVAPDEMAAWRAEQRRRIADRQEWYAEQRRREIEQRRIAEAHTAALDARHARANVRAEALLLRTIPEREAARWRAYHWLYVRTQWHGATEHYSVSNRSSSNVRRIDTDGSLLGRYCIVPYVPPRDIRPGEDPLDHADARFIPLADRVLFSWLLLSFDMPTFRAKAAGGLYVRTVRYYEFLHRDGSITDVRDTHFAEEVTHG